MDTFKPAMAMVLATAFGVGGNALGQPTTAPAPASRPPGAILTIPELTERLSREGYGDIRAVERKSDKLYKVEARDAQGRTREMQVDGRTAEILASEEDDKDEDDDDK
jgi:Peptidase propeptide and YPEB domain